MNENRPAAPQPSAPQPTRALSAGAIAALVIGALVATIVCTAVLSGLIYLYWPSAQDALAQANLMPRGIPLPFNRSAWSTQRVLGDIYKTSLDAVVADEQVIQRLGEPIETDVATAEMYRRATSGAKLAREETIEYDVIGPKARATVSVTAVTPPSMRQGVSGPLQIDHIKVTLEDGSVHEVDTGVPEYAEIP